jgi:hypothetical protein
MPSCSTAKNPRGVTITFTEEDHKYSSVIDGKDVTYISGTTFISRFFPPFDPTGCITRACARKRGLTVESLRQQWREKADNSCRYGTKIHECCEDTLLERPLRNSPSNSKEEYAIKNAVQIARKVHERSEIVGVEKIIFDERLKIAGTIDLLIRAKKDNRLWICDWKTNEKIETENKYNKFGFDPISHVPAINFHEYGMQLNLYEYLLKCAGYCDLDESVGKVLFHITEKGVKSYPLPDYQKEIKDMISVYEKGLEDAN